MMMSRRVLLGAAIAAPVAAVVPLLLPKAVVPPKLGIAVLEADSATDEALLCLKHLHGRVGRFSDRVANWRKEHAAIGFKPIGWQQCQDDSWYNEETGALVSNEMVDDLRCSIQPDDVQGYMVLYSARPI